MMHSTQNYLKVMIQPLRQVGLVLLLLGYQVCIAEARIKGLVVINENHGQPAANVAISVDGQHRVTPNDGSFNISFSERKPGETVRLIVKSPNWVVVNAYAMDHTLAINPDVLPPFEILIAKPSDRERMALKYYQIQGSQTVEQQLKLKLAELEGKSSATTAERSWHQQEVNRLLQERDIALKQIQYLAQELAIGRSGEDSAVYNHALTLFLDGKIDKALELLSEKRLKQETALAQMKSRQVVDSWLLRAKMLTVNFDFEGAARAYEEAIKLAPEDAEIWFQFANFHQSRNRLKEARKGYERALSLYHLLNDEAHIASTLNNL